MVIRRLATAHVKMAEHSVCVSVSLKNGEDTRCLLAKKICKFSTKLTMCDIVEEVIHPIETKGISPNVVLTALDNSQFSVKLSTTENGETFTIDNEECLQTALDFNSNLRYMHFVISLSKDINNNNSDSDSQLGLRKNAFTCLFESRAIEQRSCKIRQEDAPRFTEKDKLYNVVCDYLSACKCYFPNSMSKDDVKKNVVSTLWYLDGNTQKFAERAEHKSVTPIPERFVFKKRNKFYHDVMS